MKAAFYVVLVLFLLVGGFFALNTYIYEEKQGEESTFATYLCSDGRSLTARFEEGNTIVFLGDDRVLTLAKVAAESGAQYEDATGQAVFRTTDASASFEEGGVAAYAECMLKPERESFERGDELWTRYTNEDVGFSFEYRERPQGYFLQEPRGADEHPDFAEVLVLTNKKEHEELLQSTNGREGPPTITTLIFNNPERLSPSAWADANPGLSNIGLIRGDVVETSVAGAPAIRYTADGLYLSDTLIIANGGYIYAITGSYLEENSLIRRDFEPFLTSFAFLPANSAALRDGEHLGFIHAVGAGSRAYIEFDDAVWLSGAAGENAAIAAGLCTEETRSECLPNDYFIENSSALDETVPLEANARMFMQTWEAGDQGIMEKETGLADFAALINDSALHWSKLPYTITVEGGAVTRIEEVYVP